MTLSTTEPTDQRLVSELPSYIRALAVAINAVTTAAGFALTELAPGAGTTSLSVGTDLSAVGHEIVIVDGTAGASEFATIIGGTAGQIKTFIFQDGNVHIRDGAKAAGKIYMDMLPALGLFEAEIDDVLELVNIGGDGAAAYGYWKELDRLISVK